MAETGGEEHWQTRMRRIQQEHKEAKQAIMLLGIANAVKPTPQMLLDVDDSEAGTQSATEKAMCAQGV